MKLRRRVVRVIGVIRGYTAVMRIAVAVMVAVMVMVAMTVDGEAQTRRRPPAKPAPKPPARTALKTEAATVTCPEPLGTGMTSGLSYCFVLAGRDPAQGVLVTIPAHAGPATLIFTLHNRHTYSEEIVRAGRGFASYKAGIGVLTMTGELISRAAVMTEFRTAEDLHERISGGAGPSGAKAVAPLGAEVVYVTIPAGVEQVSLLGELLEAVTAAGRETATPGRTVALVSNVRVEYRPAPPAKTKR